MMSYTSIKRTASGIAALWLVFSLPISAPAGKSSKTSQLKAKQNIIDQQAKTIKQKIYKKKLEARNVSGQLEKVEVQLEHTQSSLASNQLKLQDAKIVLQRIVDRLEKTKKQLERRQQLLQRRVVDIYEGDDIQYLNVVLGSTDMWTFLTRAYYLQAILDSDAKLIAQIKEDKKSIEKDKVWQAQRVTQIADLNMRLSDERDEAAGLVDARLDQLKQIEHSKDLYERALDELEAESRRIGEEIRRYQSTPQGRKMYAKKFSGGLSLPVNGRITSRFGYRYHPITGVYKLHDGVDIAAPSGAPIHAAADGVVVSACRKGAYGNAVVIDHGGGISTMYGHCSVLLCHAGQEVRRGDVIARVGSTGMSTGPHCHFTKYVNGGAVNPF